MRVFVTGASGFIGTGVVGELINGGHQVIALVRSDKSAVALESLGAKVLRGDLNDLDSLRKGANESDGVIHLAFIHDFANFEASCKIDRLAVETMCKELEGSDRPFILTSGTLTLAGNELADEDTPAEASSLSLRAVTEQVALSYVSKGVRSIVVRLPPTVHGEGDHGFVPILVGTARAKKASVYIGEGKNRWPAVHRFDAAVAYRLAFEKAPAGSILHVIAEEGVPTREISAAIGKRLNLPLVSKPIGDATDHFAFLGTLYALDNPTSSAKTRKLLGWEAKQPSLLEDLDSDAYYKPGSDSAFH